MYRKNGMWVHWECCPPRNRISMTNNIVHVAVLYIKLIYIPKQNFHESFVFDSILLRFWFDFASFVRFLFVRSFWGSFRDSFLSKGFFRTFVRSECTFRNCKRTEKRNKNELSNELLMHVSQFSWKKFTNNRIEKKELFPKTKLQISFVIWTNYIL